MPKEVQNAEVQSVDLKQFVKIVAANKNMTISEVAKASGREQSTISNMLSRGNVNIKRFSEVLTALDEEFIVVTKNGQKFKILT